MGTPGDGIAISQGCNSGDNTVDCKSPASREQLVYHVDAVRSVLSSTGRSVRRSSLHQLTRHKQDCDAVHLRASLSAVLPVTSSCSTVQQAHVQVVCCILTAKSVMSHHHDALRSAVAQLQPSMRYRLVSPADSIPQHVATLCHV